eukprot:PLAT9854.1.p1 GENE.PLAT9854.1~~PLAT9854.1.p1  ORF type:complete len:262 (+),score=163.12 PLAT9854.1:93-878(+)
MFEARLTQGSLLKKIVEAMKEIVTEVNLDCTPSGIALQAMDPSHVTLVNLMLRSEGFDLYRCDRNITLGLNLVSLAKVLKCAGNDDVVTIRAEEDADSIQFVFENEAQDRISDFELKLMSIDSEHLSIPETEYKCVIKMPSGEFQRIIRDYGVLGDTCTISGSKEGVKFSVTGDLGTGNITCKQNSSVDKEDEETVLMVDEPVELKYSLRYLNFFTKASTLSGAVVLSMTPDLPIMVEYRIAEIGHIRYFLAPKLGDEEEG